MIFQNHTKQLLMAAGIAAAALFATQAGAQNETAPAQETQPSVQAPAPAPSAAQSEFSDEKLKSFAVAFLEVDKITKEYMPKMQQASSEEEQKQVRDEAGAKMVEAVENSQGITVEEYNKIIESAQADPDLAQKISGYIQQSAGGQPAPTESTEPEAAQ